MTVSAVARPLLDWQGEPEVKEPPAVLRSVFESGAAQVIFLATRVWPIEAMSGALSADERARGERFTNSAAASRFVAGRWLLRSALAAVVDVPPEEVRLEYGEHGKPALADPPAAGLAFNLSHSGDLAAMALARGRIGIDIERVRSLSDMSRLAVRILTRSESAAYEALPVHARLPAMIAAWARKEAVLKALGTGISGSLSSVEVSVDPTLEEEFVAVASDAVPERWSVRALAMPTGYQGALALENVGGPLLTWQAFAVTPDR